VNCLRFNIGEKVKVKIFGNGHYPGWWVEEMKPYSGKKVIIQHFRKSILPYSIHGCCWGWKESDFEKIVELLPDKLFEI